MHDFLRKFDGTTRTPRKVQIDALEWLSRNWNQSNVFAMQLPTGVGKSAIAEAIKHETGGHVIVPSNVLMDHTYIESYPKSNYVKGRIHYSCTENEGFNCDDVARERLKCKKCVYRGCKKLAVDGRPTFFNPISFYYLKRNEKFKPKVLIVDEAHLLKEMMLLLAGTSFRRGYYKYPDYKNEVELIEWMAEALDRLRNLQENYFKVGDVGKYKQTRVQVEKVEETLRGLRDDPQNYAIYRVQAPYRGRPDEYLNVMPAEPPTHIREAILDADKIILMSATLPKTDVMALLPGRHFLYYDAPSPIPKEQRQVLYRPAPEMTWQTPAKDVAAWIRQQLDEFPNRNTIAHVTYSQSKALKEFFPGALVNTPDTKNEVLEKFKKDGGFWLASGCSEGIDLPNDECRLNLIPKLVRLNPTDPLVKKRLAVEYGKLWYDMETIKTVVQQAGRSTRGLDDHSITIVGDPAFGRLIMRNKDNVPRSFMEGIVWRKT